ncbi:MAG: acyl-ACP--UDP-N-acetylglucosamine O-acyltransferase [Planctomycetota bacterium]|jgi:UDP-N-acetylglucosamine acyltransferase
MPNISSKAIVEETAQIARDVRVGPFAYIGPEVRIGPGCVIENNVTITGRTTLGANGRVFPMAVIGIMPEGEDEPGECIIGEANAIREFVTIYAGRSRPTRLGVDNLIMISSVVEAGATIGDHGIFANCTHIREGAVVDDYVRASAFPVIEKGVRVGAYTFINGYAGVDRDVPPFATVEGCPVRVRGVNAENLRRCGFGDRDIRALKDAFRELYDGSSARPDAAAIARLESLPDLNPHVRRLIEAVRRDGGAND